MEHDRAEDGTLTPLPMQSVDTGMGLERVMTIMEGTDTVFRTDVFRPILLRTAELLGLDPTDYRALYEREDFASFCVIADHVRSVTFSLADGGMFSNEGRGYVLRRILRRAVRFGRMLGFDGPFLHQVSAAVVSHFGDAYPELRATANEIAEMIRLEEERFFRTIDRGIARFGQLAADTKAAGSAVIDGGEAFKLYDTYGFPLDLTQIMAEEVGLGVDTAGFQSALAEQQARARAHDKRYDNAGDWVNVRDGVADRSVAWGTTAHETEILRLREHSESGRWEILLRETPFYAEAGGEVGDAGEIRALDGSFLFEVVDTLRTPSGLTHFAYLREGTPNPATLRGPVLARVDPERRFLITCNHTATHLLHAALHEIVSEKAFQAGSLVAPDRLRFDYSFNRPLTPEEITALEAHVNDNIRRAVELRIHLDVPRDEAKAMGAMAIFGEKYGEAVRVVEVPGRSTELCGGCHVSNTRDIAFFRILSETGVAAGVRRIEAVTNQEAFRRAAEDRATLERLADSLKTEVATLPARVGKLSEENQELARRLDTLARRVAEAETSRLAGAASKQHGVSVVSARLEVATRDELLLYADALRPKLQGAGTALLGAEIDGKPALVCVVTDPLFQERKLKAGDLINDVAALVGGKGGGRPTLAQAGGTDLARLDEAIAAFEPSVAARLAN